MIILKTIEQETQEEIALQSARRNHPTVRNHENNNSTPHPHSGMWMLIYKYSYHILYSISRITQDNRIPFSQQYYSSTTEFPSPSYIIALCGKAEKQECKAQGQKLTDPPDLMEWTAVRQQFSPGHGERRTSPSQR